MGKTETDIYIDMNRRSKELWQHGLQFLPGGDTRNTTSWNPYPLFIASANGYQVVDVDGNKRIDFINNMTSLIFGNSFPPIVEAIQSQATLGVAYNAANEHQVRLAKLLCDRLDSVDMVRFTNSGTEATLNAIRLARAYSGRSKIAKCEGGYHGTHDSVSISVRVDPRLAGDILKPKAVPSVPGLSKDIVDQTIVIPFNEVDAALRILEYNADSLAAIIVEPILGGSGMIPADRDYLSMLRSFSQDNGVLLIFDEVVSFRLSRGGAQELYGITPDITALGKLIGGGLPIGAIGASRVLMELFNPTTENGPFIGHSGTFNGNPLTMRTGSITLENLTPEVYLNLDQLGTRLRDGVVGICSELEVPVQVTGLGSLFGIHFTSGRVNSWRDVVVADVDLKKRMFLGMLNEGVMMSPELIGCVSAIMTADIVDLFLDRFDKVLRRNV